MLNVYILQRPEHKVGYDEISEKVVVARNSKEARKLANKRVGDEGMIWEMTNECSCKQVDLNKAHIVLSAYTGA